jgi:hypothetical protein
VGETPNFGSIMRESMVRIMPANGTDSDVGAPFNGIVTDKEQEWDGPKRFSDRLISQSDFVMGTLASFAAESTLTVTSITKSSPAVVTTSGAHGYSTGDYVSFGVTGMTELNDHVFYVTVLSATTFSLAWPGSVGIVGGVDSTGYGTFISGGVGRTGTFPDPDRDPTGFRYHIPQANVLCIDPRQGASFGGPRLEYIGNFTGDLAIPSDWSVLCLTTVDDVDAAVGTEAIGMTHQTSGPFSDGSFFWVRSGGSIYSGVYATVFGMTFAGGLYIGGAPSGLSGTFNAAGTYP